MHNPINLTPAELKFWQDQGLLPVSDKGEVLLWKHVKVYEACLPEGVLASEATLIGNLGRPYQLSIEFGTEAVESLWGGTTIEPSPPMATAGPWGCLKDWRLDIQDPFFIAISCSKIEVRHNYAAEDGVFHVLKGRPIALYRAMNIDCEAGEFDPILLAGECDPLSDLDGIGRVADTRSSSPVVKTICSFNHNRIWCPSCKHKEEPESVWIGFGDENSWQFDSHLRCLHCNKIFSPCEIKSCSTCQQDKYTPNPHINKINLDLLRSRSGYSILTNEQYLNLWHQVCCKI